MKKKTVALLLALVMVFGAAVGGTIAWLTATTTEVENTFTVGDIGKLTLTEETGPNYNIVPGVDITKDPVVAYDADENDVDVYVFVKVSAPDWDVSDDHMTYSKDAKSTPSALSFDIDNKWTYLTMDGEDYVYYTAVAAATNFSASVIDDNTIAVSDKIIDGADEIESLAGTLTFKAYAIQKDGFTGADPVAAAWNAVK